MAHFGECAGGCQDLRLWPVFLQSRDRRLFPGNHYDRNVRDGKEAKMAKGYFFAQFCPFFLHYASKSRQTTLAHAAVRYRER
jgi:hypothetical protein